ncbi:MAG: pteridine reductase [Thiotrichales bacterium]
MLQAKNEKVALVTGSARRVGAQTVRKLHKVGFRVVIHYRNSEQEATSLAEELNALRPASAKTIQGDLLKIEKLPELAAATISQWGRLDVLVNNASAFFPTPIGSISSGDWDLLVGSNLKAPLFLSQAVADEIKTRGGSIVNMVDIHGDRPLKDHTVYSVAKAGLIMLTKSLARELGPEARVNGVAPGVILWPESPQNKAAQHDILAKTALKREGHPEDIASTIEFLVCHAPYITGQIITVDGGRTLQN